MQKQQNPLILRNLPQNQPSSPIPFHYNAKVVSVYDGDTCTVDVFATVYVAFGITITHTIPDIQCRLAGIDAPEMRSPTLTQGRAARDALRGWILNKDVILKTYQDRTDKYGRILVDVIVGDTNMNYWMVDNNHAVPYMEMVHSLASIHTGRYND